MKKSIKPALLAILAILILTGSSFGQTRIRFARGRTSATVRSTIGSNGERNFVLRAAEGQRLSANVSSRNGCVTFGTNSTSQSYTTDYGDNYINIFNTCGATTFTLTVTID
jgi:hypothetical protein